MDPAKKEVNRYVTIFFGGKEKPMFLLVVGNGASNKGEVSGVAPKWMNEKGPKTCCLFFSYCE
jgi:hypothetical protein